MTEQEGKGPRPERPRNPEEGVGYQTPIGLGGLFRTY